MKRTSTGLLAVALLISSTAFNPVALAGDPVKPTSDAAKDALKKGTDAAKDAAKHAQKSAEDALKKVTGGNDQLPPEMVEAMKRWEELSTPNEHHKHLEAWVGEWDLVVKWWMTPDMPPEESHLTAVTKPAMGGRFVVEKVTGQVKGPDGQSMVPFEGMSTMGYDNHKKQYVSTWIDNMSTSMLIEWGECDGEGKVITTKGSSYDPMSGVEQPRRSVATIIDPDTRRLEAFVPGPDGVHFRQMEINYTRKK